MTLREAITAGASRIAEQEDLYMDARRDAETLLLHVLGAPRTFLFLNPTRTIRVEERARFDGLIARRFAGEPIQYIIGRQEFYGLDLRVTPAVLIPRPETELLVEAVLARLARNKFLRIVDVGTGSGAIAIAIAHSLPLSHVTALDVSDEALSIARQNAAVHGLGDAVRCLRSDLLEAVSTQDAFDAIVSNPPYIPESNRETLHRQVREFEPETALYAGTDGLDLYQRLIPQAFAALKPGGLLAMEIGHGQRNALDDLLKGWDEVDFLNDLQGIPRVVVAHRREIP